MPSVATLSGNACSCPKAFSIASVNTDSRATQKSLGRMATGQEGSLAAIDSTAAAVDREVGVPRSEMKRLVARVNQNGPSQVRRSRLLGGHDHVGGRAQPFRAPRRQAQKSHGYRRRGT